MHNHQDTGYPMHGSTEACSDKAVHSDGAKPTGVADAFEHVIELDEWLLLDREWVLVWAGLLYLSRPSSHGRCCFFFGKRGCRVFGNLRKLAMLLCLDVKHHAFGCVCEAWYARVVYQIGFAGSLLSPGRPGRGSFHFA